MNKQYFQNLLKTGNYKRKDIYTILKYTVAMEYGIAIDEGQLQKIIRAHRTLQELIPNDFVGARLEREWRDEHGMKSQGEFVDEIPYFKGVLDTVNNLTIRK